MGRYRMDDDEKRIIRSIVRLDEKRRRGKLKRKETHFDRKARAAIEAAERDIELGGATGEVRDIIVEKIRENIPDAINFLSVVIWGSSTTRPRKDRAVSYGERICKRLLQFAGVEEDTQGILYLSTRTMRTLRERVCSRQAQT